VESAGMTDSLPMEGADSASMRIEVPGGKPPVEEEIWFVSVSPGYFSTLKTPMLFGREFEERDGPSATPVAIVNRTFANLYYGGAHAIGSHLAAADSPARRIQVVGVVSDFRQRNPEEDEKPLVYFPVAQNLSVGRWSLAVRVRASSDMGAVARGLGKWLRPVDPQLYWDLGSLHREIHDSESLTLRRPIVTLLASFGGLALILAIVGVFGVTSFSVAERTREIGLRIALGAARGEIAGLVFRELLGIVVAGLAGGAIVAFGLTRFFPTEGIGWSGSGIFLYGVSRTDALTYTCAAALLTSVVLTAAWIPARRAMRVDPMAALRYE
jgi:putative ABC transport system permease protein